METLTKTDLSQIAVALGMFIQDIGKDNPDPETLTEVQESVSEELGTLHRKVIGIRDRMPGVSRSSLI